MTMLPLKAHVKNGRLVLDEPTDLPEGEEVELVPLVEALESDPAHTGVALDVAAERHAVIAERIARVRAGDAKLLSVDEVERGIREELDV